MDYKKIYEDLIEHRKMMPKLEGVYYEKHHIKPVCLGGGDEKENLIWLSGEDHYMAHCLLAKAYRTKELWFALSCMAMTVKGVQKVRPTRRMIGVARREATLAITKNEPRTWVRISDGAEFYVTRTELRDMFDISMTTSARVVTGWQKTGMGFYIKGTDLTTDRVDNNVYEFKNLKTGETIKGTRADIKKMWGLTTSDLSGILTGRSKFAKGVCLADSEEEPYHRLDPKKYHLKRVSTGEQFCLTRAEFTEKFGFPAQVINSIVDGRLRNSNDFSLAATTNFDKAATIYNFRIIKTGEVLRCTVRQLCREFDVDRNGIKSLTAGKFTMYYGFCMDETPVDDPRLNANATNQIYTLRHKETGDVVVGTSRELNALYGLCKENLSQLAKGTAKSHRGYVFVKRENPVANRRVLPVEHITSSQESSKFSQSPPPSP